jgi:transcriptional regulator with XRE-family HTH domain
MMLNSLNYFDKLPTHPQPKPLESFTSYVIRLAQLNGVQTLSGIASICSFGPLRYNVNHFNDYPPPSLEGLSRVTLCSTTALRETTFFYLLNKFGRFKAPRASSYFLSGSVVPCLRYCPKCLDENCYYNLTWRFFLLPGCVEHTCRLLDKCGHCDHPIPLFGTPFKIGVCPTCNRDLRVCQSEPLGEKECQIARHYWRELQFFLSPKPWETDTSNLPEAIGLHFASLRQARHLTLREAVHELGTTLRDISGLEGIIPSSTELFKRYTWYAEFLGTSLESVLEDIAAQDSQSSRIHKKALPEETDLVKQVIEAIAILKSRGEPVTRQAVSRLIQLSVSYFGHYPQVVALLDQAATEIFSTSKQIAKLHGEMLFEQVQQVIKQLEDSQRSVTYRAIGTMVGLSGTGSKYYPRVKALVEQSVSRYRNRVLNQKQQQEEKLVEEVESSIEQFKTQGATITQTALRKSVGVPLGNLRRYPRVRALLEQYPSQDPSKERRFVARENDLVTRIELAVEELISAGQPLTQSSICEIVGVDSSNLRQYPRARVVLLHLISQYGSSRPKKVLSGEELVVRVQVAIEELESYGQRVTQQAVGKMIGIPPVRLRKYPQLSHLLEQIAVKRRQHLSKQRRLHQAEIVEKAKEAIQELEALGKPLTQRAICSMAGISAGNLSGYPEVSSLVIKAVKEDRAKRKQERRLHREEELVVEVIDAICYLQSMGKSTSVKAIARTIRLSVPSLNYYSRVKALLERVIRGEIPCDSDDSPGG